MVLYSNSDMYKLYGGSMLDMLDDIDPCSIDSIVTDPPYELNFMNKSWDNSGIAFQKDTWEKCFSVLKPGGYLLAFGAPRTFHRIACAIEDAGFEIRDTIMWLYGTGMPKSMNLGKAVESKLVNGSANTQDWKNLKWTKVETGRLGNLDQLSEEGKQWDGFGTSLKPAYEPVIVARKPCGGSTTDNVIKYGVGGINIDECRIPYEATPNPATNPLYRKENGYKLGYGVNSDPSAYALKKDNGEMNINSNGRFPANVILTYDDSDFDEVCGGFPIGGKNGSISKRYKMNNTVYGDYGYCNTWDAYDDSGSAARYFYCAKATKRDRDEGCGKNFHTTVKPTALMQYLVRLVTPRGGTVLDPFMGSGSTGKAVAYENNDRNADYSFIGVELNDDYLNIAKARIDYAMSDKEKVDIKSSIPNKQQQKDDRRKLF